MVSIPLGTHSFVGERLVGRCQDDQRKIGNRWNEARVPRRVEVSQMLDPSRWIL